jgi:adenosylhomocysteine nucleosidase
MISVIICSKKEFKALEKSSENPVSLEKSPFKYLNMTLGNNIGRIYYAGTAGKTNASALTQYTILEDKPEAIINIGTCGGIHKDSRIGDLIIPSEVAEYDYHQKFGKGKNKGEFHKHVHIKIIDFSFIKNFKKIIAENSINKGIICSADKDVTTKNDIKYIKKVSGKKFKYILGADWESASIARVCKINGFRKLLILRTVSDMPGTNSQDDDYSKSTKTYMKKMIEIIKGIELN